MLHQNPDMHLKTTNWCQFPIFLLTKETKKFFHFGSNNRFLSLTTGFDDNLAIPRLHRMPKEIINPQQVMKAIVNLVDLMQGSSAFKYLSTCRNGGRS